MTDRNDQYNQNELKPHASCLADGSIDNCEIHIQTMEKRRSRVRIIVTYSVTFAFLVASLGMLFFLLYAEKWETALGIFSGLTGVASSIIGYWFGSRQRALAANR